MAGGAGARNRGAPPPPSNNGGNNYGPPSQYGGPPPSQYGGPPQSQYGGQSQSQFGGPPHSQYGPPPSNYGGSQWNGQHQQYRGPPAKPRSGGYDGGNEGQRPPYPAAPRPQAGGPPQGPPGSPTPQESQMITQQSAGGAPTGASQPNPFGPGLGFDPSKSRSPAGLSEEMKKYSRLELPVAAYNVPGAESQMLSRPKYNDSKTAKKINIRINQYRLIKYPNGDISQYDVKVLMKDKEGKTCECDKEFVMRLVFGSKVVQDNLRKMGAHPKGVLFDGRKIAWSSVKLNIGGREEASFPVDLDVVRKRKPNPNHSNVVLFIIKYTANVRLSVIEAYITKKMGWDNSILAAVNFLDHLMRQNPSEQYTMVKRSFFSRGATSEALDNCIVGMKGVYSSIRLCNPTPAGGLKISGLALNVDVANGTFWTAQDLHQAARNYCKQRNPQLSYDTFANLLKPTLNISDGKYYKSDTFKDLAKFAKLKFTVKHRNKGDDDNEYMVKEIKWHPSQHGANAKTAMFKQKDRKTGQEREVSVFDYFKENYNIQLQYWQLPVVVTNKAGMFPMELCCIKPNQKYGYKLDPAQTASMIKFAVTRPQKRIESIQHGIGMLKWHEDPYLQHFGVQVDPQMTVTEARLLPAPDVEFANGKISPGTSGRWRLDGKKFLFPNPKPLKSWGFCVIDKCVPLPTMQAFVKKFVQVYASHGGVIANPQPVIVTGFSNDMDTAVLSFRKAAGDQSQMEPQILFYVLPARDSWLYERLKRNTECRFGLVSQMLNKAHIAKLNDQYCSNVAMKVNAKLGGTTAKSSAPGENFFKVPTVVVGVDVSHPSPGSPQPSMAALTMSMDRGAIRYAAGVQTNGYRSEMLTPSNVKTLFMPLIKQWVLRLGNNTTLPQHIYYFRDGVSEGQYTHVLDQEIDEMKRQLKAHFGPPIESLKWTVAVCTKRHHIRFFPKETDRLAADKNGNPFPGTLVERDVTHPFEYDFYLNSHSAIQGTSRPVHYHVLKDDANVNVSEYQRMIYQHCYQYMRSTTPVSLYPAIYYAHLASNRARCHEAIPVSEGPRGGQKFEERRQDAAIARINNPNASAGPTSRTNSTRALSEARPLLPLGNSDPDYPTNIECVTLIRTGMWYI